MYRYSLKGRSLSIPSRIIRLTVSAANADDARAMARLRCPDFGTTVESPRRGALLEPPDPMDEAKAREFARWRDTDVEVV